MAERQLYEQLRTKLDDAYYVIHSASWHALGGELDRRDGEADFVIIHPLHGLLILEVKGGYIERDPDTGKWYTTPSTPRGKARGRKRKVLDRDPFSQARRSMHGLLEYVKRAGSTSPFALQYRLGYGVWVPNMLWHPVESIQGYNHLILDQQDMLDPAAGLERLYTHFAGKIPPAPLSSEAVAALIGILSPSIGVQSSFAVALEGETSHIQQLTAAQFAHLEEMWRTDRQAAVRGPAGTGKTVLAVEMAWRLAAEGQDVLFLCANQSLADWITYRIEHDPRPQKPHFDILSVKSLVSAIAERGGQRQQEIGPLNINSATDQKKLASILSNNVWALETRKESKPYDAILVDEAQDIEQALWTPIQKLLRHPLDDFFYVFYDERQRVDLPGEWVFRPAGQKPRHQLTTNCRNTRAIYELMCEFIPELAKYPFSGPPGRPIEYFPLGDSAKPAKQLHRSNGSTADNDQREGRALAILLDDMLSAESGLQPEDVMIITCRGAQRSHWYHAESRKVGRHTLRWLRAGQRDGQIALSTIRAAKGLEAKVVILAELDGVRQEKSERRNRLLYIAISRAIHHVAVLGTESELIPQRSLWGSLVSSLAGG